MGRRFAALLALTVGAGGLLAFPQDDRATSTEREVLAAYNQLGDALKAHHLEDLATRAALEAALAAQDVPSPEFWDTDTATLPGMQFSGSHQMTALQGSWWPGDTAPYRLVADDPRLTGLWSGKAAPTYFVNSQGQAKVDFGTLWHGNGYNLFGTIEGLELWDIGDFAKGREGHGLYVRCVPHLDTTIRNYRVRRIGGQAIQREWRTTETDIPRAVWGAGGGTFLVEDCDFQETGMISKGVAARASWAISLCNTMQATTVRRVTHINYYSPAPHEGSLFVGYGQGGFRTPWLLVEDCLFWNRAADRATIFLEGVDVATIQRVTLKGNRPYIDATDDCGSLTVREMPQDTLVRIKHATQPHNAPYRSILVLAGEERTINP
jgi:hypothetical protein